MKDRYFLDTNIFVYAFDVNAPGKAKEARELIKRTVDTGQGIVSYQVVQEFFNVALRRFAHPLTSAEAEQYLITVFRPLLATPFLAGFVRGGLAAGGEASFAVV
jgi:predicted nucleic acid-binding protein